MSCRERNYMIVDWTRNDPFLNVLGNQAATLTNFDLKGLVGGPLLVGGLGPGSPGPLKSGPGVS